MNREGHIDVVIVDDQTSMRTALVDLLDESQGIDVVGEAGNGEEALAIVQATLPDVVLMDLRMPVMNGVEATRRLSSTTPEVAVIVHTVHGDESLVLEAFVAGARGYILKGADPDDIVKALKNVAAGHAHVSDELTRPIVDRLVAALNAEKRTRIASEEAARRLEVINDRQREFAIMSSHELRTPLTLLLVSLEALANVPSDDERTRRELERIATHGAHRLQRLAENLEIAGNAEMLELDLVGVDVSALCAEVVAGLAVAPDAVQLETPCELWAVGDSRRLRQVIDNLVRNALDASPGRNGVVISARSEAGQVIVDVRDRGSGFAVIPVFEPEIMARLVPFTLRPTASGGLGLGLWVANELVTAMGGRMVARNGIDGGASVSLYLNGAMADRDVVDSFVA